MKQKILFFYLVIILLFSAACQATPERENIVGKNDFEQSLTDSTKTATVLEEYTETLPTHITQNFEKPKADIAMDSDVICSVEPGKIPVYKFVKAELPQEKTDEWVKYFAGDAKLYAWPTVYTKSYYQETIIEAQKGSDVDGQLVVDQEYVEELKKLYAEAPDGNERHYIDSSYDFVNANPKTGKVCLSAAVEVEGDDFTIYAKTLTENGEGNSEFQYSKGMQVISEDTIQDTLNELGIEGYGSLDEDRERVQIGTITEEEAKPAADRVIKDLGIMGFELVKSGKACLESFGNQYGIDSNREEIGGIELIYLRKLGGISVDPDIANYLNAMTVYDENGTLLTAPTIAVEKIKIFVSNAGEVESFSYRAMLEESETLSEGVTLKPFGEIVERAAEQLYYQNVYAGLTEFHSEIKIDSISLVMTYSQAENDVNAVLLIPAWNFSETRTYYSENNEVLSEDNVSVTINAVDGSRA